MADKLNRSPVWNHTMLFLFMYAMEMFVLVAIVIGKLFTGKLIVAGAFKAWLFMTVPLIVGWLIFGLRNYYINKKIGIWNYYRKKTRNGKLID